MLTRVEQSCTNGMHEMTGYRTTGIFDIHVHIFLAVCILLWSLDRTARQCWSIGQFWSVLYNQSNCYRFLESILLLVSSVFSLLSISHHLSSTFTGRPGTGQITVSDQHCGPCIAAVLGLPQLKESVSHIMAQF